MMSSESQTYLEGVVAELRKQSSEAEWFEFKVNNEKPEDIGEYLSALSNMAALAGKMHGYVVWGIDDQTHDLVGTTFKPSSAKKGAEELENWLLHQLSPRLNFRFHELEIAGSPVVILEIPRAVGRPVQFSGVEYVRVGSYRKKLKDNPQIAGDLWRVFDERPFEILNAMENVAGTVVFTLLDVESYFSMLGIPFPNESEKVLDRLTSDGMIAPNDAGNWNITNLGAVLFAKKLSAFTTIARKAIRVVVYDGRGRTSAIKEQEGAKGYASGFEGLVRFINGLLPHNEVLGQALRREEPMYPEIAVRELVANALIHQDLSISGAGPMIEIFDDRIEVTNPGVPLMDTSRLLDTPPRSRNEALASFMRRVGVCEERGSGIDRVVLSTELFQLPAPLFETPPSATRAVLFAYKALNEMDSDDRIRACYLHACLRYVERDQMTNSSLRGRFGIDDWNSSIASRIIHETMEHGWVKPFDPAQGKRYSRYVPIWA
jgi:ATP-dependent DNA helicase RecG